MGEGILRWFGAGVLAAGLMTATIAGAGAAGATEGSSTEGATATASQPKDTADADAEKTDAATEPADEAPDESADQPGDEPGEELGDDLGDLGDLGDEIDEIGEEPVGLGADDLDQARGSDRQPAGTNTPAADLNLVDTDDGVLTGEPEIDDLVVAEPQPQHRRTDKTEQPQEQRLSVFVARTLVDADEIQETKAVAFAAPEEAAADATAGAPQIPGIVRMIGTIVFNLYGLATKLVGGPPILPANSTVTVRTSTLFLDCGCDDGEGYEVQADWYFPEVEEGQQQPNQLIYLQHGFLARGPWYSHTAAALAEQTNSIVVAPSITSNFLAADACWLGAPVMHKAIADLFRDDNGALAESALAAGYADPIPNRVVLMGHSLGGGAVSGAAGFMSGNASIDKLAGVVLLDGVGLDAPDKMLQSLKQVPDEIPIYQLAAPVYFWNNFGVGIDALVQARPGTFVGVTLVDGSHVDSMRGGNPLIQFAQELVAGYSHPENGAAAEMLMVGWVKDMFAGNKDHGIYGDLGEEISIVTPKGPATAVALPNSLTRDFILNPLQQFVSLSGGIFTFEPTCVADAIGQCSESIAA
ncbi:alpha/beta hydrolase [Mycolicibacterium sp. XJ1819]